MSKAGAAARGAAYGYPRRRHGNGQYRRRGWAFMVAAALAAMSTPMVLIASAGAEPQGSAGSLRSHAGMAHRGIVKSVRQAAYSTELAAPVAAIERREGETFKTGDKLIAFDCRRQEQELAALAALERETSITFDSHAYLMRRGAANRTDVEIAMARRDKSRAEVEAMRQRLRSCVITAPFDGTVVELHIHAYELPVPNKPFVVIAAHRDLEVEIIVPSRMLAGLASDHAFAFRIDETGRSYPARLRRIAGVVDAMSQTVKLYAVLDGRDDAVLPGMSGTATFNGAMER